jgi:hypothetical protein
MYEVEKNFKKYVKNLGFYKINPKYTLRIEDFGK